FGSLAETQTELLSASPADGFRKTLKTGELIDGAAKSVAAPLPPEFYIMSVYITTNTRQTLLIGLYTD
ncbi:MAG: hypothetical protein WBG11_03400, partial [Methylocella sp.]